MSSEPHNKCLCACEPCWRGNHCRGEFCKSAVLRLLTDGAEPEPQETTR